MNDSTNHTPSSEPSDSERAEALCRRAFATTTATTTPTSTATSTEVDRNWRVARIEDVNQGRGAFSVVLRLELEAAGGELEAAGGDLQAAGGGSPAGAVPASVVAKLPVSGPNGEAAINSGAYRREALAYRELLVANSPLPGRADRAERRPMRPPVIHHVEEQAGTCSLVMEDLSPMRAVDQLDGLAADDALLVAEGLAEFHRRWAVDERLHGLAVRRNTIAGLAPEALQAGLAALDTRWAETVPAPHRASYHRLVDARDRLVDLFGQAVPTLCHGDPRADNLVFAAPDLHTGLDSHTGADQVVLFDWQQMAVQFGEADLAWMAATSLDPDVRRRIERDLVEGYGGSFDRYRLGLALPGLTVLLLAQREASTERTRRFIATSLQRIAAAIDDLDVDSLARRAGTG